MLFCCITTINLFCLSPRVTLRFALSLDEIGDHVPVLALPVIQIYKIFTAVLLTETVFVFIRIPFTWIQFFCHFQYGMYLGGHCCQYHTGMY
jgi:hypothetical protein